MDGAGTRQGFGGAVSRGLAVVMALQWRALFLAVVLLPAAALGEQTASEVLKKQLDRRLWEEVGRCDGAKRYLEALPEGQYAGKAQECLAAEKEEKEETRGRMKRYEEGAYTALENGNVAGAKRRLKEMRELDEKAPEVMDLEDAIAEAERKAIVVVEDDVPPAVPSPEAVEQGLKLSGEARRLIQMGLTVAGHDPGLVDGVFGGRTRDALRAWQRAKGLEVTGHLTREQSEGLAELGREEATRKAEAKAEFKRKAADPSNLFSAVRAGDVARVKGLLAAGADPNAKDDRGMTVLGRAMLEGRVEVVVALQAGGADINKAVAPLNKTMVVTQNTSLRQLPNLTAEQMGAVESGQQLKILAQVEGWYLVPQGSGSVFLQQSFLRDLRCRTVDETSTDKFEGHLYGVKSHDSRSSCKRGALEEYRDDIKMWSEDCIGPVTVSPRDRLSNVDSRLKVEVGEYYYWCSIRGTLTCFRNVVVSSKEICE